MSSINRRRLLQSGAFAGAGLAMPMIFTGSSASAFTNEPTGSTVTLGFNVPQTGPYAEEGLDELRAFELAVEHLNGGGDGGMMSTFSSKVLDGTGIMGKQVAYVSADTQTKADAARASAQSMYNWEEGKARPRSKHLSAIFALRTLGRRQVGDDVVAGAILAHDRGMNPGRDPWQREPGRVRVGIVERLLRGTERLVGWKDLRGDLTGDADGDDA